MTVEDWSCCKSFAQKASNRQLMNIANFMKENKGSMIDGSFPEMVSSNIIALCLAMNLISKGPRDELAVACTEAIRLNKTIKANLADRFRVRWTA